MDEQRKLSLWVGGFVLAALAVGAVSLLMLGDQGGLLSPQYRLVTYFENVQGLVPGAPVRLAGKDVGRVEFVNFASLGDGRPPIRVVIQVDADVQDRIRSDSVASIGTIGLLGDKYVELQMGTTAGRVLVEGEEMASVSPVDYSVAIERGTIAIDNIATLAENVNRVVAEFGEAMGGQKVAEATAGLSAIVTEIQQGEGLLHSLIYDDYEGGGVESIAGSLAILEDLLSEVQNGDGFLHTLIYESVGEKEVVTEALDAASRLNNILAKVDEGDGTLGLLVNDPTLYDELRELLGGAQRSFVVRSLIRMSTDAGANGEGE